MLLNSLATPMLAKVLSAAVYGIDANLIDVEVDLSGNITEEEKFHTVGLPDAAVRESRDRVKAAMKNSGYLIPPTHITINLAPADLKKEGAGFDLPIAIGAFSSSANSASTAAFAPSPARSPSLYSPAHAASPTSSFPPSTRLRRRWWRASTSIPSPPWAT
jgi:hypothetical protein